LVAVTVQVEPAAALPADSVLPDTVHAPDVTAYVTAPVPAPPLLLSVEVPVPTTIDVGEADTVKPDCSDKVTTDTLTVAVVDA
jgi:hypothetical protein